MAHVAGSTYPPLYDIRVLVVSTLRHKACDRGRASLQYSYCRMPGFPAIHSFDYAQVRVWPKRRCNRLHCVASSGAGDAGMLVNCPRIHSSDSSRGSPMAGIVVAVGGGARTRRTALSLAKAPNPFAAQFEEYARDEKKYSHEVSQTTASVKFRGSAWLRWKCQL
jgi:hypothetical protein